MKIQFWRKGARDGEIEVVDSLDFLSTSGDYTDVMGTNIRFPHCDALILHSPGVCRFCDMRPDWQALRSAQGIAFSDMPNETRIAHGLLPCPSTYRRSRACPRATSRGWPDDRPDPGRPRRPRALPPARRLPAPCRRRLQVRRRTSHGRLRTRSRTTTLLGPRCAVTGEHTYPKDRARHESINHPGEGACV